MDFKHFWKETFAGYVCKHLLAAVLIVVVLASLTLGLLKIYTHHGEAETVPDLRGKYVAEAEILLEPQMLNCQVIDSIFDRKQPLGIIVDQTPTPGSTVKHNRPIYLVINSTSVRQVPLPEVRDVSFRQAEAMLKSIGFSIKDVVYEPSEYKDLVLDLSLNGRSVPAGTRVDEGSALTLVVGQGQGQGTAYVPDLIGLNLESARAQILGAALVPGAIDYDVQPNGNENSYVVIGQHPQPGVWSTEGGRIDLQMSTDRTKAVHNDPQVDEDDFF